MSRTNISEFLIIGKITSTHGLKGEVKVYPTTDDPDRFKSLEEVILVTGREELFLTVEHVKFFKQFVIVKFKEFNDINEIEKYRGASLKIRREEAVELGEDEYFEADLIGMDVLLENGEKFGVLRDVMETGANDVYIVDRVDGEEVLLPAIHDCVLDVDVEKNTMTVHLMKGLV